MGCDELWTDRFYRAIDPCVQAAGLDRTEPGVRYAPARPLIGDFDLWYVASGRGRVRVGEEWIRFSAGDLLTIFPGEHYREDLSDAVDPYVVYYVHLLPFGDDPHGYTPELVGRWPRKLPVEQRPAVASVFADLFETWAARPEGAPLRLRALALRLLEEVFAVIRHAGDAGDLPPAYPRLLRARDYIVRYNSRNLSLGEVARYARLSPSYLSALFRRYFGCSPMQYRTRQRMRAARKLLAEGLSVTRVARETGYSSVHYFSRAFRKHEGQTPTDFARSCWRR